MRGRRRTRSRRTRPPSSARPPLAGGRRKARWRRAFSFDAWKRRMRRRRTRSPSATQAPRRRTRPPPVRRSRTPRRRRRTCPPPPARQRRTTRTPRRRRTRPPHLASRRGGRSEGGGRALLRLVKADTSMENDAYASKEEDTPSSFSLSKKDDVCGIGQRLPVLFVLLPRPACSNAPDSRHVLTLRRNPQFLAFGLRISEAKSRPVHGRARDGGRLVGGLVPEAGNSNGPAGVNYRG